MWGNVVDSSWNVMAHGDARDGKWRGNWRMQWVANTLHTTSEHGVSSITTADAHTSADSSRLNWRPHRFKWTRPFRRKTKSARVPSHFNCRLQPEATYGNIIRRMRIACWITEATNTHSEYVFIKVTSRITLEGVWRQNRPRLLGTLIYERVRLGREERFVLASRCYAYTPFPGSRPNFFIYPFSTR